MVVGFVFDLLFDVIIRFISKRIHFVYEAIQADVETITKPFTAVKSFFKREETPPPPPPTKNRLILDELVAAAKAERDDEKLSKKEKKRLEKRRKKELKSKSAPIEEVESDA